jgi:hypothetical protein
MNALPRIAAAALACAALATPPAFGHGAWFAQRAGQLAMVFGVGADDLDMVKRLPKVTGVKGFDADQKEVPAKLEVAGPLVLVNVDAKPTIVSASLDYGLWSKTKDGKWHNKGIDEVPDAVISEHNFKYAVGIRGELNAPLGPLDGQRLQILPVKKELPEKMGAALKLRVLFDGKPVKGAKILTDWVNDPDQKPLRTAADGTITIRIRNQGLNVITAIHEKPAENPAKSRTNEFLATLSFVLPHEPE